MLVRRSVLLAVAGVLAAAGCRDVEQRDPAPALALAAFDPGVPGERAATIPFPNDLALRAAPFQTGDTRTLLLGLIAAGGFRDAYTNPEWTASQGIAIPIRAETFNPATGLYVPAPPPDDVVAESLDENTVALVRISDETPTRLRAARVAYARAPEAAAGTVAFLVLRPADDEGVPLAEFPPGRYVVALRGGANGVQALVGEVQVPLQAELPIALIAPNRDLSNPQNQPPGGLAPAQVQSLESLRLSFALPLDWGEVTDQDTCVAQVPVPAELYPGRCWLPAPSATITPAFAAVDQVFPHEEIASIQTFEVIATDAALQEEVTP